MLIDRIQQDLKQGQLARDEVKVSTLRMALSEIKNVQIGKGLELADADIISILQKEAKKRNESILSFRNGNREDLAQKEESELKILQAYLPALLSSEELSKMVDEAIAQVGAQTLADMGKVMGVVMGKTQGRADGGIVSQMVKEKLSK